MSSPSFVVPEDRVEALIEWAKIQKEIQNLHKKELKLTQLSLQLEEKHPFLSDVLGRKRRKEDSEEEEEEEIPEEEKKKREEKHKKRNQRLKEKRKIKKEAEKKAQELQSGLSEAEESIERIHFEVSPSPEVEEVDMTAEDKEKLFKTVEPKAPKRPKIVSPAQRKKSPTQEGGMAQSVRSQLLHVDESHRTDNTGKAEKVKE